MLVLENFPGLVAIEVIKLSSQMADESAIQIVQMGT
jgi:hypothetical protein